MRIMKVAIFHDYLNQFGGAERVLQALLEIFPEADLYTLLYDKEKTFGVFEKNIKRTSFMDRSWVRSHHRMFIPFMPLASHRMNIDNDYDLVISSSAGYAKGFGRGRLPFHISYCYTPLRYAWDIDYLKNLPLSPRPLAQFFARPIAKALRGWDKRAAGGPNIFIAVSDYIAQKINAYYEREARVIYPPVDLDTFYPEPLPADTTEGYYLMAGRLLYYKVFDLGIKAFNVLNKPLKIVGSGPEALKLKSIAGSSVEFLSDVSDDGLRRLYSGARAFIFPQVEDFGLVAAEAQACGLPVIAYNVGGGKEIVEDGKTGILFNEQTPESIIEAVKRFENTNFDRKYIARRGEIFSREKFKENIRKVVRDSGFSV